MVPGGCLSQSTSVGIAGRAGCVIGTEKIGSFSLVVLCVSYDDCSTKVFVGWEV